MTTAGTTAGIGGSSTSGVVTTGGAGAVSSGGAGITAGSVGGAAACQDGEGSGLECEQRWHTIQVPPFVEDIAFDADGNAWMATTQGLLFWDFNGTPDDTSDDRWQIYEDLEGWSNEFRNVVIDERGVKWLLGYRLHRVDDNGTPTNTGDDTWQNYELTDWRNPNTRRIVLDGEGRLWWIGQSGTGVKVLPAAEFDAGPSMIAEPPWVSLFTTELVHDVAVVDDAVWVAAESGLYYVTLGGSLADETDDVWTDFSDAAALGGQVVSGIELNPAGTNVWFTTPGGIVRLSHGADPLDEATNTWSPWAPQVDTAASDIGPVIAVAEDGAVWLRSPQGAAVRVAAADPGNDNVTVYHPASRPEYASLPNDGRVASLAVDHHGNKWLSWRGSLLHFDDGDSPTDSSDDRWTRLGRAALSEVVMELFPMSEGGAWLTSHRPNPSSTPGCSGTDTLYYVDVGALTDGLDDRWIRHPIREALSSCSHLLGLDASGHLWIKDQPPQRSGGAWHLLDVKATPADPSDDAWVAWTASEAPAFAADTAVIDPTGGLWIGDYFFSYGESPSNSDDDDWWQLDAQSPSSLAVDTDGGRWFGYSTGALRYLDDGATPDVAADDRWMEYSIADGVPFTLIRALQIDTSGNLWILGNRWSDEPQLCRLNPSRTPLDKSDDSWICSTMSDGLNSSQVFAMALEPAGHLWVGTASGLQYLELDR